MNLSFRPPCRFLLASLVPPVVLFCGVMAWSRGVITYNDHWAFVMLANAIDWFRPATWHNGFFPVGHLLFVKFLIAFGNPLPVFAANLSLALGLCALLARALRPQSPSERFWASAAVFLFAFHPVFLAHATQPGPDMAAMFLLFLGYGFLEKAHGRKAHLHLLLGGWLCGMSALWRYHLLPFAVALAVTHALCHMPRCRRILWVALGLGIAYAPQLMANGLAGVGPLKTHSAFLLYQAVYGMDWSGVGEDALPTTVSAVFRMSRATFLLRAIDRFAALLPYLFILAARPFVSRSLGERRSSLAVFCSSLGYASLISLGASERGLLPMVPFIFLAGFSLWRVFLRWCARLPSWERYAMSGTIALLMAACWLTPVLENARMLQSRRTLANNLCHIQSFLESQDPAFATVKWFSNDYDFYLPGHIGVRPYHYGGWQSYDQPPATDLPPRHQSPEDYLLDLRQRGFQYLALSNRASQPQLALWWLWSGKREMEGYTLICQSGPFKVFALTPPSVLP